MATSTLTELNQDRDQLAEELNMKTKRQYILRDKIYYEQGNKSGKLLAKVVQNKKSATTVHHIRDKHDKFHSSNDEIAKQFEQYYQSLYNIPSNPKCPQNSVKRTHLIQQFLQKYSPSPISVDTTHELESPICDVEFDKAIKEV